MAAARAAVTFFFLSAVQNCCVLHSSAKNLFGWEEHILSSGRVVFGEMDEVVFGKPAAEAVAQQAQVSDRPECS